MISLLPLYFIFDFVIPKFWPAYVIPLAPHSQVVAGHDSAAAISPSCRCEEPKATKQSQRLPRTFQVLAMTAALLSLRDTVVPKQSLERGTETLTPRQNMGKMGLSFGSTEQVRLVLSGQILSAIIL